MSTEPETVVRLRFGGRLDVAGWERRHAAGEVPDRWPYGLDRLAAHGVAVRPAPVPPAAPRLGRVLRAAGGYEWWESRSVRGSGPGLDFCWDERVGVPVLCWARTLPRHRRPEVVAGVIWLTDRRLSALDRTVALPALRSARLVWTSSSAQVPVLRDGFGIPERRLAHVPFGIDTDFFRSGPVPPTPGLVAGAGNDRHRDHPALVAAMAQVREKVPGARLELATRHPVEVPADLGVRHAALSHVAMRDLYARSAVVVVALRPNLHVSGVTVALEAMACGRPVVVTDNPGMRDYVADGETGLLVPPGDPVALATAVADLLLDPARAAAYGAAGRRAVERDFSTDAQAHRLSVLLRA